MSNLKINRNAVCNENPAIQDLEYGTFITDVPSGNNCIYVKVKKPMGKNLKLNWNCGNCVLLNLSYGTLREVPGTTCVTALKPELTVCPLPQRSIKTVMKGYL